MAKLCNREGQALALVVLFVAELLQTLAQVVGELPFVQLADDDLAEFREYLAYAVRQRVDVVEMAQRNALAFGGASGRRRFCRCPRAYLPSRPPVGRLPGRPIRPVPGCRSLWSFATFSAAGVRTIFWWFDGSCEIQPFTQSFSRPPTRCSSPALPGNAQPAGQVFCCARRGMKPPSGASSTIGGVMAG